MDSDYFENYDPNLQEDPFEDEEFDRQLQGLQKAHMRQQTKANQQYINKKFQKKTAKYNKRLAEAGITPQMLHDLYGADPGLYDEALDSAFKEFNRTIKRAARGRGRARQQPAPGRQPARRPQAQQRTTAGEAMKAAKERGKPLSDIEIEDIIADQIGRL